MEFSADIVHNVFVSNKVHVLMATWWWQMKVEDATYTYDNYKKDNLYLLGNEDLRRVWEKTWKKEKIIKK